MSEARELDFEPESKLWHLEREREALAFRLSLAEQNTLEAMYNRLPEEHQKVLANWWAAQRAARDGGTA